MSEDHQNFKLRLPPELYEELKIASVRARRTLSEESVSRLEESRGEASSAAAGNKTVAEATYERGGINDPAQIRRRLEKLIEELRNAGVIKKAGPRVKGE